MTLFICDIRMMINNLPVMLREKFHDSQSMNLKATDNYSKSVQAIDFGIFLIWEEEILQPERGRVENISAMDFYRVHIPLTMEHIGTGTCPNRKLDGICFISGGFSVCSVISLLHIY